MKCRMQKINKNKISRNNLCYSTVIPSPDPTTREGERDVDDVSTDSFRRRRYFRFVPSKSGLEKRNAKKKKCSCFGCCLSPASTRGAERKGSFVGVDTNGSGSKFTRVSLDPCEPVPRETSKQRRPNRPKLCRILKQLNKSFPRHEPRGGLSPI